jgi:hypothetical protein
MGALHSWRCYPDSESAATAVYSVVPPVLTADGLSTVEYRSGAWVVINYTQGTEVSAVPAPSLAFAPCDPGDSVADGLLLGSLVVGVWAAAWGVRVLARVL